MKTVIKSIALFTLVAIMTLFLPSCDRNKYVPSGEFYVKTSPVHGDAGVSDVISFESEYKEYHQEGDITVPATVGFGHLPDKGTFYGDDVQDTFRLECRVFEYPWKADNESVWETVIEYSDRWSDSKYDSTEQKNPPSLIFPRYGEFYPLYKETVELVFPEDAERGYVEISISIIIDGEAVDGMLLSFDYERVDGVLILSE